MEERDSCGGTLSAKCIRLGFLLILLLEAKKNVKCWSKLTSEWHLRSFKRSGNCSRGLRLSQLSYSVEP